MQTNREALLGLAERCEKAEGPDRHLDCLIENALGLAKWERDPGVGYGDADYHRRPVKPLTASIDAAMTLVPDAYRLTSLAEYGQGLGRLVGKWGCVLVPRNLEGLDTFEKQFATIATAIRALQPQKGVAGQTEEIAVKPAENCQKQVAGCGQGNHTPPPIQSVDQNQGEG